MEDNRKRRETSSSPDVHHDNEKKANHSVTPPTNHVSVTLLESSTSDRETTEDISPHPSTPVNSKSPDALNLVSKCKLFEVNASPKRPIDSSLLYNLLIGLELRVFKQEEEMSSLKEQLKQKDQQASEVITELKERILVLERAPSQTVSLGGEVITDLDARVQILENPPLPAVFLGNEVNNFSERIEVLEKNSQPAALAANDDIVQLNEKLHSLSENIKSFKLNSEATTRRAHLEGDQRDQYSRRETVRITGVPQKREENTNEIMCQIACSIGVQLSESDISVSHRSGRQNGDTPRPILVKFARRDIKNQILQNRRMARHIKTDPEGRPVNIYIDEHLTTMRAGVCKRLRHDKIRHHTKDGKIFLCISEDTWKVLDSPEDWESLDWAVSFKEELGIYPKK